MTEKEGIRKHLFDFTIRQKILSLCFLVVLPFVVILIYLLASMANYSKSYESLVDNMTIANDYNLKFKEEVDESLYKLVVGYTTFDTISQDATLKDPYQLIWEIRSEFHKLQAVTTDQDSIFWMDSMLRNLDTLENRINDIKDRIDESENYSENVEELDQNIYILTELIQYDIQYYLYYQTRAMGQITDHLHQQINDFILLVSVIICIIIVIVAIMTLLITQGIISPFRKLREATVKVSQGDFAARAVVKSGDEIEELSDSFNYMAANMQDLVDKIKEDEGKLHRMDLRILQEQINPHFLYNTLDTIVWLIEGNESEKAEEVVIALSNFFRFSLSKGKESISIREEEQHISNYLQIQQMRYHDILEYDIQIDRAVYDYQILKLTLQPLVENALYHGIKYKRSKGYIHINGEKEEDKIYLCVRDDGVGMDEEELKSLQEEIEKPCKETAKGFGLANVNERLRMNYGPEYGITIQSQKNKGTIVNIVIPAIPVKQENQNDES